MKKGAFIICLGILVSVCAPSTALAYSGLSISFHLSNTIYLGDLIAALLGYFGLRSILNSQKKTSARIFFIVGLILSLAELVYAVNAFITFNQRITDIFNVIMWAYMAIMFVILIPIKNKKLSLGLYAAVPALLLLCFVFLCISILTYTDVAPVSMILFDLQYIVYSGVIFRLWLNLKKKIGAA